MNLLKVREKKKRDCELRQKNFKRATQGHFRFKVQGPPWERKVVKIKKSAVKKMSELIVRTRDNKPNIIGITEVKPKANRYKPSTAEYSLQEYFISVFTNEPQGNIPEPKHIPLDKKIEELNIGTDLVLKHLQKIKTDKSPGPDNLHPRLLFEVKEGIAEPLGIILNQSLERNERLYLVEGEHDIICRQRTERLDLGKERTRHNMPTED
ncbi:unnamed protein product [Mytilus edulis]|uniref:Uncharacterized protein n=1 Tax=Mytilus edulis TaxID=6550 RepID=A0A8S3QGV3_MYTED|nr:unnamed protein product [Mytilus edulis]